MRDFQEVSADIIARLMIGDEPAFRIIYDKYSQRIYHFAYRFLRDKDLAGEIVQESLLRLWTNRDTLDINYPLGPYLYTIARRLSLNVLRHKMNAYHLHEKVKETVKELHNETEEYILVSDLAIFTESVVVDLPMKQQEVFRLSRQDGLSHKQIAKDLQLSENTVRNHIAAALKKLQIKFSQSGILLLIFGVYLAI